MVFLIPYLLDVIVAQSTAILELLSGEDQSLLVWGDSLLILDLRLNVVDRIAGLDLKGDGLARQGLDETIVREQNTLVSRHTYIFFIEISPFSE